MDYWYKNNKKSFEGYGSVDDVKLCFICKNGDHLAHLIYINNKFLLCSPGKAQDLSYDESVSIVLSENNIAFKFESKNEEINLISKKIEELSNKLKELKIPFQNETKKTNLFYIGLKSLKISKLKETKDKISNCLAKIDKAEEVDTLVIDCDISDVLNDVCNFLKETKKIKSIEIDFSGLEKVPDINFEQLFRSLKDSETKLVISSLPINDKLIDTIFDLLDSKCLKSLSICDSIFNYNIQKLIERIKDAEHFNSLKEFKIEKIKYENNKFVDFKYLMSQIRCIPSIGFIDSKVNIEMLPFILNECQQNIKSVPQSIDLSGIDATKEFSGQLSFNANLKEIKLADVCWVKENILMMFKAAQNYRSNFVTVDLSRASIVNDKWGDFFTSLSSISNLESKYIEGFVWDNNILDKTLFTFIQHCENLKKLSISSPKNASKETKALLIETLKQLKYIEVIDISDWNLDAKETNNVIDVVKEYEYLRELIIANNKIDLERIKDLCIKKENLKRIKIGNNNFPSNKEMMSFVSDICKERSYRLNIECDAVKTDEIIENIITLKNKPEKEFKPSNVDLHFSKIKRPECLQNVFRFPELEEPEESSYFRENFCWDKLLGDFFDKTKKIRQ